MRERNEALEILKLVASYAVVLIHVSLGGAVGDAVNGIARFAVPMFFAITGFYSFGITRERVRVRAMKILRLAIYATLLYTAVDIIDAAFAGGLTGVGEYLKSKDPSIKIVGVEPAGSPVLSEGRSGKHGLQGIGAGFVPAILNRDIIDEVVTVTETEAYAAGRLIGRLEGVLVGISSGAALHAAIELAKRAENEGKTIVVLLPDTGERYLSTPMFN